MYYHSLYFPIAVYLIVLLLVIMTELSVFIVIFSNYKQYFCGCIFSIHLGVELMAQRGSMFLTLQ